MVTENAVQSVSIPGQASAEEETYQGNVVLRVETQGRMRQALLFVDELCAKHVNSGFYGWWVNLGWGWEQRSGSGSGNRLN